jgi:5-methylcytosine-specific restriction protein B
MTLDPLLEVVMHQGMLKPRDAQNEKAFDALFGSDHGRYRDEARKSVKLRANPQEESGVPFAAYIEPNATDSGPYGGMSVAVFPVPEAPCLLTLVVGTYGLAPDEQILGRPGHARKVRALCAWLNDVHGKGDRIAWAKHDPIRTDEKVPADATRSLEKYKSVFDRYGEVIYAFVVLASETVARDAVTAFVDLMFEERGHGVLTKFNTDAERIRRAWMKYLLPSVDSAEVAELLRARRFVVIQGPPGTGKTRMADEILAELYNGAGKTIQFHPNTTYENFVGGLAPVMASGEQGLGFQFAPLPGFLMDAAAQARKMAPKRYLLHIDEINRADLSKVLGEAIYLFEVEPERPRTLSLPYAFPGVPERDFGLPDNLDILGTMNTADRSLAIVDVAVRRRFAFVDLWPQANVVEEKSGELMVEAFARLMSIFVEHASEEAFNLFPGHAYFLEKGELSPAEQLKVTIVPLLREYLAQGYVAGFAEPIRSYLQWVASQ